MAQNDLFSGFSRATLDFFAGLHTHNTPLWFEENRSIYDAIVMREAKQFVEAMGERLSRIAPQINAIPQRDKSIFRIHRDVRFSPDKRPFKTHLGIWMWEGPAKKLENSGFYFQIDPNKFMLGVGLYMFPPYLVGPYRNAVTDPQSGAALAAVIRKVERLGRYTLGWEKYKKVPAGYDPGHPLSHLLRMGGLGFQYEETLSGVVHTAGFLHTVFRMYEEMSPIHFWLRDLTWKASGVSG